MEIIFRIIYSLTIFSGIYIVTDTRKALYIGSILALITFLAYIWEFASPDPATRIIQALIGMIFFGYLSYHLIQSLIKQSEITLNVIFGSIVGFLILGIVGGQLCIILDAFDPNSFNLPEEVIPYDFFYFSYITLTSVGYGDITPATPGARAVVLFIAITGELYLTILIAILIGKYLSKEVKT